MADILLIHGSWHWAGCFYKLENELRALGHSVISVDNASHGTDQTPWDSIDSMATYTAQARAVLEAAEAPMVLLGHSMGGVTLSHLAETHGDKISKLIYLTAFMTPPGKTANDYIMAHAENPVCAPLWAVLTPVNDFAGLELATDKPADVKEAFYADCSDEDIALSAANATLINTIIPNVFAPSQITEHERHYITCSADRAIPPEAQQQMIDACPGTITHALSTSHSPFYSAPKALADIIHGIA